MKTLHKMLVNLINTLQICECQADRHQCYDLIKKLIQHLEDQDQCTDANCVASIPEHYLLHAIQTGLKTGTLQSIFRQNVSKPKNKKRRQQRRQYATETPTASTTAVTSSSSFMDKYQFGASEFFEHSSLS